MIWTAEKILHAIAKSNVHCVKEEDIAAFTGLTAKQVEQGCLKLRQHGMLEKTEQGCHLTTDAGREAMFAGATIRSGPKGKHIAPKINKNSLRIKVWRAIRIKSKFFIPDLAMLVAEGGEKDITSNIGKYIRALEKAGYIVKMPKREPGTKMTSNGHIRYWLLPERDTGPQAPVWRVAANVIYDPNTELEHGLLKEELSICG